MNKYELLFYIDGLIENAYSASFIENDPSGVSGIELEYISCFEGNYAIDFIDVIYALNTSNNSEKRQINDNDILQYYYCYKSKEDETFNEDEINDFIKFKKVYEEIEEKDLYYEDNNSQFIKTTVYQINAQNREQFYNALQLSDNNDKYNYGVPILIVSFISDEITNSNDVKRKFFIDQFTKQYDEIDVKLSTSKIYNNIRLTWIDNTTNEKYSSKSSYTYQLQGSSTGKYKSKNFNLSANNDDDYTTLFTPNFMPCENQDESDDFLTFLPENTFTFKSDAVDSTHSNNTAIGLFINKNTTPFADARNAQDSSIDKYKKYLKNCLYGIPILVFFEFPLPNESEYYYMGIYNFNLGRNSYLNLGYYNLKNIFDNLYEYEDLDNKITLFDKDNDGNYKYKGFHEFKVATVNYQPLNELETGDKEGIAIAEIQGGSEYFDFSQWNDSILFGDSNKGKEMMFGDYYSSKGDIFNPWEYDKVRNFVKGVSLIGGRLFDKLHKNMSTSDTDNYGYKFGYNAHIIDNRGLHYTVKSSNSVPNYRWQVIMESTPGSNAYTYRWVRNPLAIFSDDNEREFPEFFTKFIGVQENEEGSDGAEILEYDSSNPNKQFVNLLDYTSLVQYYTLCMGLGLVDSVKKNLNIKSFRRKGKFYIAFYDMDTALSRDNSGHYVSPFAFSDYWTAEKNMISGSTENIIYRDFYPDITLKEKIEYENIIADRSELINVPRGYDIPSSYLFAIAKYAQLFYNAKSLNIVTGYNTSPNYYWYTLRHEATSPLASADVFLNNYFLKNIININKTLFGLNYRFKYLQKNDTSDTDMFTATNLEAFHGRGINSLRYWLTKRLHILDAYFNITEAKIPYKQYDINNDVWTNISIGDNQFLFDPTFGDVCNDNVFDSILSNNDIEIKKSMFGENISYLGAGRNTIIKALPYSPMSFTYQQDSEEFICVDPNKYYSFTGGEGNGQMPIGYGGSINWTYAQSLSPFISDIGELSINNKFLQNIDISIGVLKKLTLDNVQSLNTLSVTSESATSPITLDNSGGRNKFNNIKTIDLHNSKCKLDANELNAININLNNIKGENIHRILNCKYLQNVSLNETEAEKITIDPVWSGDGQNKVINCNIKTLSLTNTLYDNLELVIDYNKIEDSTLEYLNIVGYTKIKINNCKNLHTLIISDVHDDINNIHYTVKSIEITNCNNVNIKVNNDEYDDVNQCINLSSLTNLEDISFEKTTGFKKIILPKKENIILSPNAFNDTDLEYIDFMGVTREDEIPVLTLVDDGKIENTTAGTFANSPFTLLTSESDNLKFKVPDDKYTSLANIFKKDIRMGGNTEHITTDGLTYFTASYFINNLINPDKVISFKDAFHGQTNIIASYNPASGRIINLSHRNLFDNDNKFVITPSYEEEQEIIITDRISLNNYTHLKNISCMFESTSINFVDNIFFGEGGCASEIGTDAFNLMNFMNCRVLKYMHKDSLKHIKFKITKFLFDGRDDNQQARRCLGISLYDDTIKLYDKLDINYHPINIHNFLFDENNLIQTKLEWISEFKFSKTSIMDFTNLFTDNEQSILRITGSFNNLIILKNESSNVINISDFTLKHLKNIKSIVESFICEEIPYNKHNFIDISKCIDILNFLDWDTQYPNLMNSYNTSINSGEIKHYNMFNFYKKVDFSLPETNDKWNAVWASIAKIPDNSLDYPKILISYLFQKCQFIYNKPNTLLDKNIDFDQLSGEQINQLKIDLSQITLKIPNVNNDNYNLIVNDATGLFKYSTCYLKENDILEEYGLLLDNDSIASLSLVTNGNKVLEDINEMFSNCVFNGWYRYPVPENLLSEFTEIINARELFKNTIILGHNKTYYITENLTKNTGTYNKKSVYFKYILSNSNTGGALNSSSKVSNYKLDSNVYQIFDLQYFNDTPIIDINPGYPFIPINFFNNNVKLRNITSAFDTSDFEGFISDKLFESTRVLSSVDNFIKNCKILPQYYTTFDKDKDDVSKIAQPLTNITSTSASEESIKPKIAYVFLPDNLFNNTVINQFSSIFTFNIIVSDNPDTRIYLMTNNTIKVNNSIKSIGNVKLNFKYNKDILNDRYTNYDYSPNSTESEDNSPWCLLDTWYKYDGDWRRELSIFEESNETNTLYPTDTHKPLPYVPVINLCINNLGSNGTSGGYKYSEGITYEMFINNAVSYDNVKTCLLDENLSCLYYGYIFERGNILFNSELVNKKLVFMKYGKIDINPYWDKVQDKYIYRQISRNIILPQILLIPDTELNKYNANIIIQPNSLYSVGNQKNIYYQSSLLFITSTGFAAMDQGQTASIKRKFNIIYDNMFDFDIDYYNANIDFTLDTNNNLTSLLITFQYKNKNNVLTGVKKSYNIELLNIHVDDPSSFSYNTIANKQEVKNALNEFIKYVKNTIKDNYLILFNPWYYDMTKQDSNTGSYGRLRPYANFIITKDNTPFYNTNCILDISNNTRTIIQSIPWEQNLYYKATVEPYYKVNITQDSKGNLYVDNIDSINGMPNNPDMKSYFDRNP